MKHINAGVHIDIDAKFIKIGIWWVENGSTCYLLFKNANPAKFKQMIIKHFSFQLIEVSLSAAVWCVH